MYMNKMGLAVLLLTCCCSGAQETKAPQLKVRVLLDKTVYVKNENVMVRVDLTNISSTTLCFPKPIRECALSTNGSVVTTGEPAVQSRRLEIWSCLGPVHYPSTSPREEIKSTWVILPPGASYDAGVAEALVELRKTGRWRLVTSYDLPTITAEETKSLQTAAQGLGCALPDNYVEAAPNFITVISSAKN